MFIKYHISFYNSGEYILDDFSVQNILNNFPSFPSSLAWRMDSLFLVVTQDMQHIIYHGWIFVMEDTVPPDEDFVLGSSSLL